MNSFRSFTFTPYEEIKKPNNDLIENEFSEKSKKIPFNFSPADEIIPMSEDEIPENEANEISSIFGVPFKDIARQTAQYTSRGLETVAGLPGDVYQALKTLSQYFPEVPSFLQGQESFIQKGAKALGEKLPTSSGIRETVKEKTGGFLEPQTEFEKGAGEFVSDIASLKSGGFGLGKAAFTSLLGNVVSPIVKEITGSEKLGNATKTGLYLTSALIRPGAAKQYGESKLQTAFKAIPEGETILTTNLDKNLGNFIKEIEKGGITPAKQPAYRLAKRLQKTHEGNVLDVLELPATRGSINEYRFERDLNPKTHRWLNKFDDIINKELNTYGKSNPEFLTNYREGNEILANLHQGNKVSKFISKVLGTKEIKPETLLLLGIHAPKGLALAGGAAGISSGVNFAKRLKNPNFRKYYQKTVNAALKENAPEMLKNLQKLDKLNEEIQE